MRITVAIILLLVASCYRDNDLYCWHDHPCARADLPYCNFTEHECHADPQYPLDAGADMAEPDLAPSPDLTPPPDLAPPPPRWVDVQKDVDALGCAAAGCHVMYPPLLIPNPTVGPALMQNWSNFRAYTTVDQDGGVAALSLVLAKPTAGTGVAHAGGKSINGGDPVYTRWLRWVEEGAAF